MVLRAILMEHRHYWALSSCSVKRWPLGVRLVAFVMVLVAMLAFWAHTPLAAAADSPADADVVVGGLLVNNHGEPVVGADIELMIDSMPCALVAENGGCATGHSTEDGSFRMEVSLPEAVLSDLASHHSRLGLRVSKVAYQTVDVPVEAHKFDDGIVAEAGTITMPRLINAAFVVAALSFLLVFVLISAHLLHETVAALLGVGLVFLVTYVIGSSNPDFWVLSFERSLDFVDFNVIFLILGMMILMSVLSGTGVFSWLAFRAFQLARGNALVLAVMLILLTGFVSSLLNDVTAILLVAPISIEIALVSGVHPFAFVIPEVLASNIGGAATLIGDPPSTIVGSYLGLGFREYLVRMGPVAVYGMVALVIMVWLLYRKEFARAKSRPSPTLLAELENDARITKPGILKKCVVVAVGTLVLFFIEDFFNMPAAVPALIGAAVLLVWVRPDVHEMMSGVDWTTLVFFIALFMLVGALEETGVIHVVADLIGHLAGGNVTLAVLLMIWITAIASAIVANIPFTLAVLPVAAYLTRTVPGAESNILFWALIVGADFGGNATYLGSAPNIVAAGLLDRADYHLTFRRFARDGVPVTVVTLLVATIWILIAY